MYNCFSVTFEACAAHIVTLESNIYVDVEKLDSPTPQRGSLAICSQPSTKFEILAGRGWQRAKTILLEGQEQLND